MSITENQVLDSPGSLFGSPVSIFGCIEDDDELDFASDSDDTYEDQEGVIEPDDDGSRQMDHASDSEPEATLESEVEFEDEAALRSDNITARASQLAALKEKFLNEQQFNDPRWKAVRRLHAHNSDKFHFRPEHTLPDNAYDSQTSVPVDIAQYVRSVAPELINPADQTVANKSDDRRYTQLLASSEFTNRFYSMCDSNNQEMRINQPAYSSPNSSELNMCHDIDAVSAICKSLPLNVPTVGTVSVNFLPSSHGFVFGSERETYKLATGRSNVRQPIRIKEVPMFEALRLSATSQLIVFVAFPHLKKLDPMTLLLFLDRYWYPSFRHEMGSAIDNIPPTRDAAQALSAATRMTKNGPKQDKSWYLDLPFEDVRRALLRVQASVETDVARYDMDQEVESNDVDPKPCVHAGLHCHEFRNVQFFIRLINTKLVSRVDKRASFDEVKHKLAQSLPWIDFDLLDEMCLAGTADAKFDFAVELGLRPPAFGPDVPLTTVSRKQGHLWAFGWFAGLRVGQHQIIPPASSTSSATTSASDSRPTSGNLQDIGAQNTQPADNGLPFTSFMPSNAQFPVNGLQDLSNLSFTTAKYASQATGVERIVAYQTWKNAHHTQGAIAGDHYLNFPPRLTGLPDTVMYKDIEDRRKRGRDWTAVQDNHCRLEIRVPSLSHAEVMSDRYENPEGKKFLLDFGFLSVIPSQEFVAFQRLNDIAARSLDQALVNTRRIAPSIAVPSQSARDDHLFVIKSQQLQLNATVGKSFISGNGFDLDKKAGSYFGMYDNLLWKGYGIPTINTQTGAVITGDISELGASAEAQQQCLEAIRKEVDTPADKAVGRPTHKVLPRGRRITQPVVTQTPARKRGRPSKEEIAARERKEANPFDSSPVAAVKKASSRRELGPATKVYNGNQPPTLELASRLLDMYDLLLHQAIPIPRNQNAARVLQERKQGFLENPQSRLEPEWRRSLWQGNIRSVQRHHVSPANWHKLAANNLCCWFPNYETEGMWSDQFVTSLQDDLWKAFSSLWQLTILAMKPPDILALRLHILRELMRQPYVIRSTPTQPCVVNKDGRQLYVFCYMASASHVTAATENSVDLDNPDDSTAQFVIDPAIASRLDEVAGKNDHNIRPAIEVEASQKQQQWDSHFAPRCSKTPDASRAEKRIGFPIPPLAPPQLVEAVARQAEESLGRSAADDGILQEDTSGTALQHDPPAAARKRGRPRKHALPAADPEESKKKSKQ